MYSISISYWHSKFAWSEHVISDKIRNQLLTKSLDRMWWLSVYR